MIHMKELMKKVGTAVLAMIVRVLYFVCGAVMRIIYPTRVIYKDKAVRSLMKKGAVLIANHTNHKDGMFVPLAFINTKIYVLVTRKWYDKKLLKPLFKSLPYIPIDLENQDLKWLGKAEEVLKKGKCVLIFPEGKLEKNGVREPFRPGFLLPARHLDVSVIPMAIYGGYRVFRRQTIVVGGPLEFDLHKRGRLSAVLSSAAAECEREVFDLYDNYAAGKAKPAAGQ